MSIFFDRGSFGKDSNDGASVMSSSAAATSNVGVAIHMLDILDLFGELKINKNDNVVIKMDVEGAEYMVLRHMFVHGLLDFVNIFAIEWHVQSPENDNGESEMQFECVDWVMQKTLHLKLQPWI